MDVSQVVYLRSRELNLGARKMRRPQITAGPRAKVEFRRWKLLSANIRHCGGHTFGDIIYFCSPRRLTHNLAAWDALGTFFIRSIRLHSNRIFQDGLNSITYKFIGLVFFVNVFDILSRIIYIHAKSKAEKIFINDIFSIFINKKLLPQLVTLSCP